jgi:hypothetical protein
VRIHDGQDHLHKLPLSRLARATTRTNVQATPQRPDANATITGVWEWLAVVHLRYEEEAKEYQSADTMIPFKQSDAEITETRQAYDNEAQGQKDPNCSPTAWPAPSWAAPPASSRPLRAPVRAPSRRS